tara:strand:- start:885 stop:1535 length:651 start_codon:yes stop_codon:yes gene_type:complete
MSKNKKALIVCNGDHPQKDLLCKLWKLSDFRVAADGGANLLHAMNLFPDAIIGDFDSIKKEVKNNFSNSILHYIKEQDTNDADKAVRHCLERGYLEINLIGADGARQDQFLTNLEILMKYSTEAHLYLWTKMERMEFVYEYWEESLPIGTTISLLPVFGGSNRVITNGLKFNINHSMLPGEPPSGVSNIVESNPVSVKVLNGQILLVIQISKIFFK